MSDGVQIRWATWQNDRDQLLGIRFAVFVDEQGVPPSMEEDAEDTQAWHLLAVDEQGHTIATARLLADGQIGRMAVMPRWRQQGLGRQLLDQLIDKALQLGLSKTWLNAQCTAIPFYENAGYIAEGPVFDDAGIPHRRMQRRNKAS